MIIGRKTKLIVFEPGHWTYLSKWMCDPYYKYYFRNIPEIMSINQLQQFPQFLNMNVLMILNEENNVVGMATWDNIRILARSCCIGFLIDNGYRGRGYAKDAFMEFIYYLTHRLGCHKLIAKIAEVEAETVSKAMYGAFKDVNIIRDEFFMDGKWHNEIWLNILDTEVNEVYAKFKRGELICTVDKAVEKKVERISPIKTKLVK